MNGEPKFVSFQCPPGLQWVKDANQIIIVDEQRGAPILLPGLEAVIWEWLTLEYPYSKLLKFTEGLLQASSEEAAVEYLNSLIQHWQMMGLLEASEGRDG